MAEGPLPFECLGPSRLHYNYFRDYDPGIGRYVQSDPIGLMGGINSYGYVGASPLGKRDPRGLRDAPGEFDGQPGRGTGSDSPYYAAPRIWRWMQSCGFRCELIVGLPCKSLALATGTFGAGIGVYGGCLLGTHWACEWYCDQPKSCEQLVTPKQIQFRMAY